MTDLADEKYVAFTTFRKDGTAKPTPVWVADVGDGRLGFTTASSSWKVKRLRNDPHVTLQPSDSKGKVRAGTTAVSGTAVASADDFDRVWPLILAKYGLMARGIKLLGQIAKLVGRGSGTDTAVIITLDPATGEDS